MAKLEIEIGAINDELKKVLKDSATELNKFAKGLKFDNSGIKTVNSELTTTKKLLSEISVIAKSSGVALSGMTSKANRAEIDAERLALARSKTEAQNYKTELAKLNAELGRLRLAKIQAKVGIDATNGSYAEAKRRLAELAISIRNTENGLTRMTPALSTKINEYRKLNEQVKAFDRNMGISRGGLNGFSSSILGSLPILGQLTTAVGLANLVWQSLQRSFTTNLKFDALNYSMKQISGNATKFGVTMNYLRVASERLGLDFVSTVGAFKQWDAAVKFSNLSGEESVKIFDAVANAGAKLKLSNEQVQGTFLALSQMLSKGVVSMEELRRQLGDRIPGAFQLAAKAMGISERELNKLVSTGKLASEDFLPKFAKQLDIAFGNNQKEKIESLQASVNRFSTALDLLNESKSVTTFFASVVDGAAQSISAFDGIVNSSSWKEFFARIGAGGAAGISLGDAIKIGTEYEKLNSIQKATYKYAERDASVRRDMLKTQERIVSLRRADYNIKQDQKSLKEFEYQVKVYNEMVRINKDLGMYKKKGNNLPLDDNSVKSLKNYIDDIQSLLQKSDFNVELANTEGLDALLTKNKQKYKKYLDELDALEKKAREGKNVENRTETLTLINTTRDKITNNELEEEKQIRIKYEQETQDYINSLYDAAGVERSKSRQVDLQNIENYYKEQRRLYRDNSEKLKAIDIAEDVATNNANKKWDEKDLDSKESLYNKLDNLLSRSFIQNDKLTKAGRERNKRDLEQRLEDAKEYFRQLEELYKNNPLALEILQNAKINFESTLTGNATKASNPRFDTSQATTDALNKFQSDFIGVLTNIGNRSEETFGGRIGGLITDLGTEFTTMFDDVFRNQLTQAFRDFTSGAKVNLQELGLAAASFIGNAISGLSSPTSVAGQGIGGAISGAASGAMSAISIGTALGSAAGPLGIAAGAIVGGLIGLFSGMSRASKAKKQEALRQKQLEEQKRTNEILEKKLPALSYVSSIVGRQTADGIVTGVDVDATGKLVARIQGRELLVLIEKEQQAKERGL